MPADATLKLARDHDLGPLEGRILLKSEFRYDGRSYRSAELCRSERGLWLLAASDSAPLVVSLLDVANLRYDFGRLGDQLSFGSSTLSIPFNQRGATRTAIGLARMQRRWSLPPANEPSVLRARHIEATDELERALLGGLLESGELVLAFLHAKSKLPIFSALTGSAEGGVRLIVSDRRSMLVALGELGDVREMACDEPLAAERRFSHTRISVAGLVVTSRGQNNRLFAEAASLSAVQGPERLMDCARLNFTGRSAPEVTFARRLIEESERRGHGLAPCAQLCVRMELGEALPSETELRVALERLRESATDTGALSELFESWRFSRQTGTRLVDSLRALGMDAEPWTLELHARVHTQGVHADQNRTERARADIAYAEHLIACGAKQRARELLVARLAEMPSEALEDLLPPNDADLTRGAGGQHLRIRVHELLAEAQGGHAGPDVAVLAELARLQPLVRTRVETLARRAEGTLEARAERIARLFSPATAERVEAPAPACRALSLNSVEEILQHPLARHGGALLGRLQALLASVPSPDHGVLRDYCERLSSSRHAAAARALADAALALGVENVEAYISRGAKGIGLRAYEGSRPFVLIGGKHLEGDDGYMMSEAELRFAVAAEVAHLRYGHTRVTSSEVWAGAVSKSWQSLDFALGVLPALHGLKFVDRVEKLASKLPTDTLRRVLENLANYTEQSSGIDPALAAANESVLSRLNEELVAAHRVMQLTADRTGLLLAGDISAAVRAMLLVRGDYRELVAPIESAGLDALLSMRTPDGKIAHQDLAVRIAALAGFYLSDDYVRLSHELGATH
ncbi:MAG TPA: hypothetical protein VK524_32560 [Polyangiaceae bacterium]|nr:hypothetical protein [Polyangiaceae bacterium]